MEPLPVKHLVASLGTLAAHSEIFAPNDSHIKLARGQLQFVAIDGVTGIARSGGDYTREAPCSDAIALSRMNINSGNAKAMAIENVNTTYAHQCFIPSRFASQ